MGFILRSILLFLMSNSLFAQDSFKNISTKDKKFLDKLSDFEKVETKEATVYLIENTLDTVSKFNYELKISLLEKLFYLNKSTNDFENCYRILKKYNKISNEVNEPYYKVKSQFLYCIFFKDIGVLDKFNFHLDQVDKIFTDKLQLENPSLTVHYNLQRISQAKHENNDKKREYFINKNLELFNNIDHTDNENYYPLAQIAINYGDFIDSKDQDMSLKYYKISNDFAHKLNNVNLMNFNRMRISGCLINKNQIGSALDSLRVVTKTNKDLNISYLHYHTYIDVFNRLNIVDSVRVYENLIKEIDVIFNENASKIEKKTEIDYSNIVEKVDLEFEKENRRNKLVNLTLIATIIIGTITVVFIIRKVYFNKKRLA